MRIVHALVALAMVTGSASAMTAQYRPREFTQAGPVMSMYVDMLMPTYDRAHEQMISGDVIEIKRYTKCLAEGGGLAGLGLHLILETPTGTQEVHVGPTSFVAEKGFVFAKGDQLEVTGAPCQEICGGALLAREITRGDKMLTLRDGEGRPMWLIRMVRRYPLFW
jgi:hypothetical protein